MKTVHCLLLATLALAMTANAQTQVTDTVAHAQDEVDTRIGKLQLNLGLPTKDSVDKLYDEIDFQRGCQAFLWGLPTVGVSGWQAANAF